MLPPISLYFHSPLTNTMQRSTTERLLYGFRSIRFHPVALALFWLCITLSISESSRAQQLHTYMDRDSVEVGEPFHLILVVQRQPEDDILSWPDGSVLESEEIHLLSREHFRPADTRDSLRFRLQYFGLQDTTLQSMAVHLQSESGDTLTLRSPELPLHFRSVTDSEAEFRPMKPLYDFARQIWPWLFALALIVGVAYWIYRRMQKKEAPVEPKPPPSPFVDPLHELERSIQRATTASPSDLLDDPTPSTIELGDAIRIYLERVYRIQALEMTSGEIIRNLREWPATETVLRSLNELFKIADRIKFARYQPTVEDIQHLRQAALQFLQVARDDDRGRIERLRAAHESSRHMDASEETHRELEEKQS